MAEETKKLSTTKMEGTVYLSSYGTVYHKAKIDADRLKKYSRNAYGAGVANKHRHLIFNEKYSIEVQDKEGNPDEDLSLHLTQMFDGKEVRLWSKMQTAWNDVFWFGMSFFNPVWEYRGSEYYLEKLRRLPPESFATAPYGRSVLYSEILQGVTLDPQSGEPEYYQTLESLGVQVASNFSGKMMQSKLTDIFTVSDPSSGELAGSPIVLPIAPIISMLDFSWQAQLQKVNRIGAPIMFMEIQDPSEDDIAYGQRFLANWGKNTGMQIRPNMKLIIPDLKDNSSAIETINALSKLVIDYFTPASLIAKDGTLIGGSSASEQELLLSYIRGNHAWITEAFEQLPQTYLEANAYDGYTARIIIPSPSIDKSEIWLKQAQLGFATQSMSLNEIRDRLELEELDEEGVQKLKEEYAQLAPEAVARMLYAAYGTRTLSINERRTLAKRLGIDIGDLSDADIQKLIDEFAQMGGPEMGAGTPAMMKARLAIDAGKVDPADPFSVLPQKKIRKAVNKALDEKESDEEEDRDEN